MQPVMILFLRALIVFVGVVALALLLWEPHLEGRNTNATVFAIYFNDPFLAFAYIASVPFFVGLLQAFKVLGFAWQGKEFTSMTEKSLRTIRYCAIATISFVAVGELFLVLGESDDRAGGVFIGALITLASIVVVTVTVFLERAVRASIK